MTVVRKENDVMNEYKKVIPGFGIREKRPHCGVQTAVRMMSSRFPGITVTAAPMNCSSMICPKRMRITSVPSD